MYFYSVVWLPLLKYMISILNVFYWIGVETFEVPQFRRVPLFLHGVQFLVSRASSVRMAQHGCRQVEMWTLCCLRTISTQDARVYCFSFFSLLHNLHLIQSFAYPIVMLYCSLRFAASSDLTVCTDETVPLTSTWELQIYTSTDQAILEDKRLYLGTGGFPCDT